MKFWRAETRIVNNAVESALRQSAPEAVLPPDLHRSIMRAVRATRQPERRQPFMFAIVRRFKMSGVLSVTGFAALIMLVSWLVLHNRPQSTIPNSQALTELSTVFNASRDIVDTIPSVTVGPLSDELDRVNLDLNRTADFLIATLP